MNVQAFIPLARHTTLRIGGPARYFIEAGSDDEIQLAIDFARKERIELRALGMGSNVLVPDSGIETVVLHLTNGENTWRDSAHDAILDVGAGAVWDAVVDRAVTKGLFGVENLAGVPGTVGGAVVQNIGAYGAELATVFEYAETINSLTGECVRVARDCADFGYRESYFKKHPELIITTVGLRLSRAALRNISYPDLAKLHDQGASLATPAEIAAAVRTIRAGKFPTISEGGTAGSFFKNPIVQSDRAESLAERYPGLPRFTQADGRVKVSLAWILDHVLKLRGHAEGGVRLYEKQPLVIVVQDGTTASDVDAFAHTVAKRVYEETGITIEREVETFGKRFFS